MSVPDAVVRPAELNALALDLPLPLEAACVVFRTALDVHEERVGREALDGLRRQLHRQLATLGRKRVPRLRSSFWEKRENKPITAVFDKIHASYGADPDLNRAVEILGRAICAEAPRWFNFSDAGCQTAARQQLEAVWRNELVRETHRTPEHLSKMIRTGLKNRNNDAWRKALGLGKTVLVVDEVAPQPAEPSSGSSPAAPTPDPHDKPKAARKRQLPKTRLTDFSDSNASNLDGMSGVEAHHDLAQALRALEAESDGSGTREGWRFFLEHHPRAYGSPDLPTDPKALVARCRAQAYLEAALRELVSIDPELFQIAARRLGVTVDQDRLRAWFGALDAVDQRLASRPQIGDREELRRAFTFTKLFASASSEDLVLASQSNSPFRPPGLLLAAALDTDGLRTSVQKVDRYGPRYGAYVVDEVCRAKPEDAELVARLADILLHAEGQRVHEANWAKLSRVEEDVLPGDHEVDEDREDESWPSEPRDIDAEHDDEDCYRILDPRDEEDTGD